MPLIKIKTKEHPEFIDNIMLAIFPNRMYVLYLKLIVFEYGINAFTGAGVCM